MAKTWNSFLPYVLGDVKEVPTQQAENAVRDAVIEFCEQSYLWCIRSEPSDLLAGQATYGFQVPTNTKMVRINMIECFTDPTNLVGRFEVHPISYADLTRTFSDTSTATSNMPRYYTAREPGVIQLYPIPSIDLIGGLFAEIAIAPKREATSCPDFILENYVETIGWGAKAKLLTSVGTPWSNPEVGLLYEQKFRAGMSRAESRTNKSKTTVSLSVRGRKFGGTA